MSVALKHLEDLLRFNATRNVRLNDQVHELRKRDCNVRFHVVLVLKQTICVFVSGCIASFTNRVGSVRISVSGEVIPGAAQRGCPLYLRCSMPDLMR